MVRRARRPIRRCLSRHGRRLASRCCGSRGRLRTQFESLSRCQTSVVIELSSPPAFATGMIARKSEVLCNVRTTVFSEVGFY